MDKYRQDIESPAIYEPESGCVCAMLPENCSEKGNRKPEKAEPGERNPESGTRNRKPEKGNPKKPTTARTGTRIAGKPT